MQKKIANIALRSNTNVLIIAAALAISLSMGIRSTFGLFQTPMNFELGFDREIFGFAMALQQLLWGLFQPICGMIADRYGSGRVIVGGAIIYSFGLFVMSGAETPFVLNIGGGWLIGFGLAATSFSVVLGALGRLVPVERQSVAFGIASAGGHGTRETAAGPRHAGVVHRGLSCVRANGAFTIRALQLPGEQCFSIALR